MGAPETPYRPTADHRCAGGCPACQPTPKRDWDDPTNTIYPATDNPIPGIEHRDHSWVVTGASLSQLADFARRHRINPATTELSYAGCGSHEVALRVHPDRAGHEPTNPEETHP